MKALIFSIVIFCCLQSTVFADCDFVPEIPKFKGCRAKCVAPADTNHLQRIKKKTLNNQQEILNTRVRHKIISLSPAITEIIFALGAGKELIAVSDFCVYPPEVKEKEKVGGVFNLSFEKMFSLKPNLIIYQGEFPKIRKFCKTYKIPECNVQLDDLISITNSIQQIGKKIGKAGEAKKIRENIIKKLSKIKRRKKPVSVFVCVGRESGPVSSCTTIGKKSFINEMLKIAGGSNICEDIIGAYPTVSSEVILSRKPEIIFELRPAEKVNAARLKKDWKILGSGEAVVILTNDYLMVPGPRIVKIAEEFKKQIEVLEAEKEKVKE